ncbi:hypothetical protein TNCV_4969391 [Trichonephila clavipes]|nr:hypothetical protein TNCV_4969391 [Trichonephila clavipes]
MNSATAAWGTLNAVEPQVGLVEGERWEVPTTPRVFYLTIWVELSLIVLSHVWCSKLWLTTGVHLALSQNEFRGPRSDVIRQVALVATTALQYKHIATFVFSKINV